MQKSLFENEILNIVQKPTLHKADVSRSTLLFGDCLIESDKIETGSVDLILTDFPYGNMRNAGLDGWENNKTGWDFAIDPKSIYEIANDYLNQMEVIGEAVMKVLNDLGGKNEMAKKWPEKE